MILIRLLIAPLGIALAIVLGVLFVILGFLQWVLTGESQRITITLPEMRRLWHIRIMSC